jgi:hypothetical protein
MSTSSQMLSYCNFVSPLIELSWKALDTLTHLEPWLVSMNGNNDLYMTSPKFTACRLSSANRRICEQFLSHTHLP